MSPNDELRQDIEDLYDEFLKGNIQDFWEAEFIQDVTVRFEEGHSFSEKQLDKIEELVDKYL